MHKKFNVLGMALFMTMLSGIFSNVFAQQATLVVTDQVREMEFHDQITLVGRSEAWAESRIVAEISGRVKSIDAGEGVPVQKGGSLVSIDPEQIKFSLEAVAASSEQARLESELVQTQMKRAEELFHQNLISQAAYDSSVAWAGIKIQRHNQLQAEKNGLELDLKRSAIRALYDGYTGRRLVDVGEWVNPGMPVFEMVDLSRVRVKVDLPEKYFGRLRIGSPAEITFSGNGNEQLSGIVTGVSPNASDETHTFPVIIEVPNDRQKLGGGMLVRARLSLDDTYKSLAVSKDAIIRQGPQTMVYTIAEGKAAPVPVTTSSSEGKMIAVEGEGLHAGMPVVIRGNERIFPGSPVMTAEDAAHGNLDSKSETELTAN